MFRRLFLSALACTVGVLAGLALASPAASAGPVEDAVDGLRDRSVFVHPQAGRKVDVATVERAIGDAPIKIAILPKKSATEEYPVSEVRTWPRLAARELPGNTIATISGRRFYAGSEVLCGGLAGQAASRAIYANEGKLDADENSDLTVTLVDFVAEVRDGERCDAQPAGRGDRYADEPAGADTAAIVDDTATMLPWVVAGLVLGALAAGTWVLLALRRARGRSARDRAQTRQLVEQLGAEVAALPADGADAAATRSRTDAAGRHREAEALLAAATTDVQFAAIRNAALAGLSAARATRLSLGLEPGPPVEPAPDPLADAPHHTRGGEP